jgi:hypothetical protein
MLPACSVLTSATKIVALPSVGHRQTLPPTFLRRDKTGSELASNVNLQLHTVAEVSRPRKTTPVGVFFHTCNEDRYVTWSTLDSMTLDSGLKPTKPDLLLPAALLSFFVSRKSLVAAHPNKTASQPPVRQF